MCGITGFFLSENNQIDNMVNIAQSMGDKIIHRGPDDCGVWVDDQLGIALTHRRLSILDLSPEGHQPMSTVSGRYVLSYNGEVYNFAGLRKQLVELGFVFRGNSDTEVILAAIDAWGLELALKQFVGMFAFALWDKKENNLHLVRDRLGIKPLYYGWEGKTNQSGGKRSLKGDPSQKVCEYNHPRRAFLRRLCGDCLRWR